MLEARQPDLRGDAMFEGGKGLDYNCFVPSFPCTKSAQKPKAEKHAKATYGTEYANPHPLLKERKSGLQPISKLSKGHGLYTSIIQGSNLQQLVLDQVLRFLGPVAGKEFA